MARLNFRAVLKFKYKYLFMRFLILFVLLIFFAKTTFTQENFNLELLANVQFGEDGNDCWGFVDDQGTEYAVMGTRTATRIFSLEDPSNPIPRYTVFGSASVWRDIKYYNKHLYATTDQGRDGLLIIDVSGAPDTFSHFFWKPFVQLPSGQDTLLRAHNIYIDENGIAYLAGHNIPRRGVLMLDLKDDPKAPVILGAANLFYSHDAYTRGDTLYSSELNNGFAIYDVKDKANPVELARITTSNNFTHNAWLSDDGKYVFTTDEVRFGYVDAYDISDMNNIRFTDKFRPIETLQKPVIPHNTHYFEGYNVVSWYTDGLVIFDAKRPENLVKVAAWDTHPDDSQLNPNANWFHGCWGAYPYLPSGLVIASDINTGLYIFRPTYKRAAYLEGNITADDASGNVINVNGANIEIVSTLPAFTQSDFGGFYKTGLADEGLFEVKVSHPNYDTFTGQVQLVAGEVTIFDVKLNSSFLRGAVVDDITGEPLENVSVVVVNESSGLITSVKTNNEGAYTVAAKANQNYNVLVAKWGYLHESINLDDWTEGAGIVVARLKKGYQDDFFADLGWKLTKMADVGNWERGRPVGTTFNGNWSNPPFDSDSDLGEEAYVTGNRGGDAGFDDVDGGETEITSPEMDFTNYLSAELSYRTWFFNSGGAGSAPNDIMTITLSNGQTSLVLEEIRNSTTWWSPVKKFKIQSTQIPFTDKMTIKVMAADYDPGHLVEGGFDQFLVVGESITSTDNELNPLQLVVSPNPANDVIYLKSSDKIFTTGRIVNAEGRLMKTIRLGADAYQLINIQHLAPGFYILELTDQSGKISEARFVKQ